MFASFISDIHLKNLYVNILLFRNRSRHQNKHKKSLVDEIHYIKWNSLNQADLGALSLYNRRKM